MEYGMLGPLRVVVDGDEVALNQAMPRRALAVLLCQANTPVSADVLADVLWGDRPPARARKTVQVYVHRLRRTLGDPARIASSSNGYTLVVNPGERDVDRMELLARTARATTEPARRAALLRDALALWRGVPMSEFADVHLVRAVSDRLVDDRLTLLRDRVAADLDLGRHTELIGELTELVAQYPLHEQFRAQLMVAMYRCGRQADALATYLEARRYLLGELGVEPGEELRACHAAILCRDPALTLTGLGARPAQLPAPPRHFVGRDKELRQLDGLLAGQANAVVISAVSGTPGVGKTSLAVHWAHRVRGRFPDGQLYVDLRGFGPTGPAVSPGAAISGFLEALGVVPQRIPVSIDQRVSLYRSLLADRRMLVVLDNARDTAQIRPLLPGSPGCLVVTTSRDQLAGLIAADDAYPLVLNLLSTNESVTLLSHRLGAERVAAEPEAVRDIVESCARLPIALAIVAGRAAMQPRFPLAALAGDLRGTRAGLAGFTGEDAVTDVRTIFSWSYRTLGSAAAALFRHLGLHPGQDIGPHAAASLTGTSIEQVRSSLAELRRTNLISQHVPGRYAMHDLLRAYALELSGSDPETIRRILDHYLHTSHVAAHLLEPHREEITLGTPAPGVCPTGLDTASAALLWFTEEHPTVVAAVRLAADHDFATHAWQLAWTVTTFQHRQGLWDDLIAVQQVALAATGADAIGRAHAHHGLGRAYFRMTEDDHAARHLDQALHLYESLNDHLGQARTHLGLNLIHTHDGRYTEALQHAERALSLFRAADHISGQAESLNAIGWIHALLGNYPGTLSYCRAALTLLRQINDRHAESNTWDSIGYAQHRLGHHSGAIDCYQRALAGFRETGERYLEAETLARLGDAYHDSGAAKAARTTWQRAFETFTRLGHPDADKIRLKLDDTRLTSRPVG